MSSFVIFGTDNGEYAYSVESSVKKCPSCGKIHRPESSRAQFNKLKTKISSTYDNELLFHNGIVEQLQREFGLDCFEAAGNYSYVLPSKSVQLDHVKRKVKIGNKCPICSSPSHVVGATPCFLKSPIESSGFYRSNLEFGDLSDAGKNLSPLVIVTQDIYKFIKSLKPTGMDASPTNC